MLKELGEVVQGWKSPDTEMVAYRSFNPFFPLLRCNTSCEVQLWAVWAMHHVCSKNPKRYCTMLRDEGGIDVLQGMLDNPDTNPAVAAICQNIVAVVQSQEKLAAAAGATAAAAVTATSATTTLPDIFQ
ncbi:hypothetical protein MTO96_029082 [Rhipicephalus appendiculatus]